MHATLDIGLGGVGWGMLTLVASCIGCARYVRHRVGWGGVGHVDVGCKLQVACLLTTLHVGRSLIVLKPRMEIGDRNMFSDVPRPGHELFRHLIHFRFHIAVQQDGQSERQTKAHRDTIARSGVAPSEKVCAQRVKHS